MFIHRKRNPVPVGQDPDGRRILSHWDRIEAESFL